MKFKFFLILFIFVFSIGLNALQLSDLEGRKFRYVDPPLAQSITFTATEFEYKYYEEKGKEIIDEHIKEKYRITIDSGVPFIEFGEGYKNRWLILYNKHFIVLYESDGKPFFIGFNTNNMKEVEYHVLPGMLTLWADELRYQCDSELIEKVGKTTTEYRVDNLLDFTVPAPWVENSDGHGIGVKITTGDIFKAKGIEAQSFFFSNGYVSWSRPDLYKKNARVKKIRIYDEGSGNSYDFELADTPDYQEIDLLPIATGEEIIIEILDVYPGTLYKDTCINQLLYYAD